MFKFGETKLKWPQAKGRLKVKVQGMILNGFQRGLHIVGRWSDFCFVGSSRENDLKKISYKSFFSHENLEALFSKSLGKLSDNCV